MSSIAITDLPITDLPSVKESRPRRRVCNHGRFVSKTVRARNAHSGKPWWQPSRSSWRPRVPRSVVLAAALREELEDEVDGDVLPVSDGVLEHWQLEEAQRTAVAYEVTRFLESSNELGRRARKRVKWIAAEMDEHAHAKLTLRTYDLGVARQRVQEIEALMARATTPREWDGFVGAWIEAQLRVINLEVATKLAT